MVERAQEKVLFGKKLEEYFNRDDNTYVINIATKYNSIRNILNDSDIVTNYGEEIFFQHTWMRQILLDCLCHVGEGERGKYVGKSLEFARSIAINQKRTSKDVVENIADLLTRIKVKVGKLGEFGLGVENELRKIAEVESMEYHIKEIASSGASFVILIDDLDLGWDNSITANNLLLGLLSTANYLTSISGNIYCCVFLREDVYSILISQTQHSDKYRNIERIRWSKENLIKMLSERINYNWTISGLPKLEDPFHTVFPQTIGTNNTDNWLVNRTLSRPRELLQFARFYTEKVSGTETNDSILKESEVAYSSWKLDDLCAEYSNQYPGLVNIFAYWKSEFYRHKYSLKNKEICDMLFKILTDVNVGTDWYVKIQSNVDYIGLLKVLYEIGFIGDFSLGGEGGSKTFYSYDEQRHEPRFDEVQIHPCFRKAVNTVDRIR